MLGKEIEIFLQHPEETNQRILHPGSVVEVEDGTYTARFEEEDLGLEPGLEFLVYYELNREFVKQGARIKAVIQEEESEEEESETYSRPLVAFETTSDPASAESRQYYRSSTVVGNRTVEVADEATCKLLDVSITGFAVISGVDHKVGAVVPVKFSFDGKSYAGTACIQSVRELADGSIRYGLLCGDEGKANSQLKDGLHKLSMAVQREQLRRRSGAA